MHIQKALDQMNLQVHRVLTEITGLSGLRILDAILAGEREGVGETGRRGQPDHRHSSDRIRD